MRTAVAIVALVALVASCSKTDAPAVTTPGSAHVAIEEESRTIDLDKARSIYDTVDTPSSPKGKESFVDDGADHSKRKHKVTKLRAAHITKLRAAVAKVLAGGPYEEELPVSEGTSCSLSLAAKIGEPFFTIDKAKREKPDAVSDLLNAM